MTSSNATQPVIVVGAGPVGMAAALALSARNVPVTVIEAEHRNRDRSGSRAIYIHGSTLQILERIQPELGVRLAEAGLVWPARRTLWRGSEVFSRTYRDAGGSKGLPHFTSLPQVRTEALLLEALEAAGVTVYWGTSVESADSSPQGVALGTSAGDVFEAAYVIAADGAGSQVRRSIGVSFTGGQSKNFFLIADAEDVPDDGHAPARVFHYAHPYAGGRHVLLVPFQGGWRVDVQGKQTDNPEEFMRRDYVAELVGRTLGERYRDRVTWVSTYRFKQVVADSFIDEHGRILLVGEAAHLFAPFGARGMNSGVADADTAASAITVARQAVTAAVARSEVERFASQRRHAALWNAEAAGRALEHLRMDNPWTSLKQRAAASAARWWEPAGRWLDEAPFGPRTGPPTGAATKY